MPIPLNRAVIKKFVEFDSQSLKQKFVQDSFVKQTNQVWMHFRPRHVNEWTLKHYQIVFKIKLLELGSVKSSISGTDGTRNIFKR